ncbi:organic hydroperoxide resistance protein [Pseudoalteromonas xiamenensis]|uniref:organic hydroperoxide resistance protein n=1 Tax=Pseudoalteromonas xiamenensis TaxID=882626 RepID=UPI0035E608A5
MKTLLTTAYTAYAQATGGREGTAKSNDGRLEVSLSTPKALGGDDGQGTNPEQLFAAGYAACFIGALKFVSGQEKVAFPKDVTIDSEVAIGPIEGGFGIAVVLNVYIPGFEQAEAEALVAKAHQVCPYSNATRGNIDVKLNVL